MSTSGILATRRIGRLLALSGAVLFACGAITATAAEPADSKPAKAKPTTSSLDDELFKDLEDPAQGPKKPNAGKKPDPVKQNDVTQPDGESARSATTKPAAKKPLNPLDEELLKDLGGAPDAKPGQKPTDEAHGKPTVRPAGGGGAGEPESDDPLVRLTRRVRDAEQRLRRTDSGEQTQELQRGIVEDLEKLIAQIEQQKSKQSSSSKSKSPPSGAKPGPKKPGQPKPGSTPGDKPAQNPTDSSEQLTAKKTERPDAGKLKDMLEKVWGRLPERERQDVMQSSFEDFPAKYQYSIEQYFKTLLQRKD